VVLKKSRLLVERCCRMYHEQLSQPASRSLSQRCKQPCVVGVWDALSLDFAILIQEPEPEEAQAALCQAAAGWSNWLFSHTSTHRSSQ